MPEWQVQRDHHEGCAAAFVGKECDCPPARVWVPLDQVVELVRKGPGTSSVKRPWLNAADYIEWLWAEAMDEERK
jgi:hypothetical protein